MITRFDYTCIYPDSQEGAIAPLRTRCYEHLYLAQAAAKNNKKKRKIQTNSVQCTLYFWNITDLLQVNYYSDQTALRSSGHVRLATGYASIQGIITNAASHSKPRRAPHCVVLPPGEH